MAPEHPPDARVRRLHQLSQFYVLAAMGYAAYGAFTYRGLFRVLAELQLRWIGSYGVVLTSIGCVVVLVVPPALLARRWIPYREFGRLAAARAGPPVPRAEQIGRDRRNARRLLVAGLVLLPLSLGASSWVRARWRTEPLTKLELKPGAQPGSGYVDLVALAHPDWTYHYAQKVTVEQELVVLPLTGSTWREGEPVAFFVRSRADRALAHRGDPAFLLRRRFTVGSVGLPGMVREGYRRDGLQVAEPHYVLSEAPPKDAEEAARVCLWIGLAAAGMCLLMAFAHFNQARRRARGEW